MNQGMRRVFVIGIAVLALLLSFLFLLRMAVDSVVEAARKFAAEDNAISAALGATAFHEEYGRFPGTNSGILNGTVLAALMGDDKELNPKGLEFFEAPPAKKGKSGITNGTLVDPWGAPFFIAFDADNDGRVIAGTNSIDVLLEGKAKAAVWNDPSLGLDAAQKSAWKKQRRYVTSWDYFLRNPQPAKDEEETH